MASEVKPDAAASWLMQTTPPSIHDKKWPGYARGKDFFDYLDKYPSAQQNEIGWPENLHSALVPGATGLIPQVNLGVQMQGLPPGIMDKTPQQRPDFNKGFSNPWNTIF